MDSDDRHHVAREYRHRILPHVGFVPIVTRGYQGTERSETIDKRDQPIGYGLLRSGDDACLDGFVDLEEHVQRFRRRFLHGANLGDAAHAAQVAEVKCESPVRIVHERARLLVALCDENTAAYPPDIQVGRAAEAIPRFPVDSLLTLDVLEGHEVGRDGDIVPLGDEFRCRAAGANHRHGDGRMRFLQRFRELADARVGPDVPFHGDVPVFAVDANRRVLIPEPQDDVQGLKGDSVTLHHVLVSEELPVARQAAASAATTMGWWWGRLTTLVPSRMLRVASRRLAKNIIGAGICSALVEKCSPTQASE
jgi:hypothetical protein